MPPQTSKSQKVTLTKTPIHLPSHAKTAVTNCSKPILGKSTGILLKKTQKVVHMARESSIDPILRENMLALKHVSLLLTHPLLLFFLVMIGLPLLCI